MPTNHVLLSIKSTFTFTVIKCIFVTSVGDRDNHPHFIDKETQTLNFIDFLRCRTPVVYSILEFLSVKSIY